MPRGRQPEVFGVADAVPAGLLGQLAWPFRRSNQGGGRLRPGNRECLLQIRLQPQSQGRDSFSPVTP